MTETKAALKKAGSRSGAAKLLGCAKITIQRRELMWDQKKTLKLKVKAA